MPKTHRIVDRKEFLTILQRIYDDLIEEHSREIRAIGGRIPVGGNGWADPFFKAEGIRSVINAIHGGRSVSGAIEVGKTVSTISVQLWNKNRSYHIQRWEKTAHDFIENTVWSLYKAQGGKV